MASRFQGKRGLNTDREAMVGRLISEGAVADDHDSTPHSAVEDLVHDVAFRFRRWREDRQTRAELAHLDDDQLKEFGIYPRPPDFAEHKFP
jgi:uncharacterized protein YjiS (DUF1127 family)